MLLKLEFLLHSKSDCGGHSVGSLFLSVYVLTHFCSQLFFFKSIQPSSEEMNYIEDLRGGKLDDV